MKKIYASLFCCTVLSGLAVYAQEFKGECLEMLCSYKCSEDASGRGKCCAKPTQSNCKVEKRDSFGCVVSEKVPCPANKPMCQEDGTCAGCSKSSDCPDLGTYCLNHSCVPCNTSGTGVRPSADAEYCDCPEGYTKRCGSKSTTINCVDGGGWTCTNGCFDDTDCPTDEYCSCNGAGCPTTGGKCKSCPKGTHRSKDAATHCVPCASCETWDETAQACVSTCSAGQLCLQSPGSSYGKYDMCNGDMCVDVPDKSGLVHKVGTINGRNFYFPPAENQYKMTHTSASRFCEHYGMHLATVNEACSKDYAYDTGHDCPNFVRIQSFTDNGKSYSLSSWNVDGLGSFWLANVDGWDGLRVTYSCGNNHSTNICNSFYPLCTTD